MAISPSRTCSKGRARAQTTHKGARNRLSAGKAVQPRTATTASVNIPVSKPVRSDARRSSTNEPRCRAAAGYGQVRSHQADIGQQRRVENDWQAYLPRPWAQHSRKDAEPARSAAAARRRKNPRCLTL